MSVNCQFSLFVPIDFLRAVDMVDDSLLEKVSSLNCRHMVSLILPTFGAPISVAGPPLLLSSTRSLKVSILQGSVFGPVLLFVFSFNLIWPGSIASVQFSHSVMSNSLQPHGQQHTQPPCPSPTRGVYSNSSIDMVMLFKHLILCRPLLHHLQSFPISGSFQWVNSSHEVAKVLEFQLQHQSFQWIVRTDFL